MSMRDFPPSFWEELPRDPRPIWIWGTGNGADKIMDEANRFGIPVAGVFASDGFVRNRFFRGYPVLSLSQVRERCGDDIVILLAFGSNRPDVMALIREMDTRHTLIIPEVPLFGGDLFDEDYTPEGDDITLLTGFFRSLRSPQGKFAIFGDYDLISEGRRNITNKILSDAGFEIIEDSVRIHLTSSRSFSICGYSYNRQVDSALPADSLLIAVIHSLDLRSQLTDADLILCGNSHSRQLNWPFSGRYRLGYHGADKLYYSSGLGMSKTAHRLFCDPEIVIVTIK